LSQSQELERLKTHAYSLRNAVKREVNTLRKRFWLEVAYIGVTYSFFVVGVTMPNLQAVIVALGLGGTSSIRVVDVVKNVIVQYFHDVDSWVKPLELIITLLVATDPNDTKEVKEIKLRLDTFKQRLWNAAGKADTEAPTS